MPKLFLVRRTTNADDLEEEFGIVWCYSIGGHRTIFHGSMNEALPRYKLKWNLSPCTKVKDLKEGESESAERSKVKSEKYETVATWYGK